MMIAEIAIVFVNFDLPLSSMSFTRATSASNSAFVMTFSKAAVNAFSTRMTFRFTSPSVMSASDLSVGSMRVPLRDQGSGRLLRQVRGLLNPEPGGRESHDAESDLCPVRVLRRRGEDVRRRELAEAGDGGDG